MTSQSITASQNLSNLSSPCGQAMQRRRLPLRALTFFGIGAAVVVSASSAAPTPLYMLYQREFGMSPLLLTTVFAVYAFSLIVALVTVGSLSDYVGRRPVIFGALLTNAAAMLLFVRADSIVVLLAARAVQGLATGAAMTTLGAAILDSDRQRGPMFNSVTTFAGLLLGALGSGVLVTFAPYPHQLVYVVLLAASLVAAIVVWLMPETVTKHAGALASLRPQLHVSAGAQKAFVRMSPVNIAGWALAGFYFCLMPTLIGAATGHLSPLIGGVTVAVLLLSAAIAVLVLNRFSTAQTLTNGALALAGGIAIMLAGAYVGSVAIMMLGSVLAGIGCGAVFSGSLRLVLPLADAATRAGLLAAFYVESYLAFAIPVMLIGLFTPLLGLLRATYTFGGLIIVLALVSFMVTRRLSRPVPVR